MSTKNFNRGKVTRLKKEGVELINKHLNNHGFILHGDGRQYVFTNGVVDNRIICVITEQLLKNTRGLDETSDAERLTLYNSLLKYVESVCDKDARASVPWGTPAVLYRIRKTKVRVDL